MDIANAPIIRTVRAHGSYFASMASNHSAEIHYCCRICRSTCRQLSNCMWMMPSCLAIHQHSYRRSIHCTNVICNRKIDHYKNILFLAVPGVSDVHYTTLQMELVVLPILPHNGMWKNCPIVWISFICNSNSVTVSCIKFHGWSLEVLQDNFSEIFCIDFTGRFYNLITRYITDAGLAPLIFDTVHACNTRIVRG